MDESWAPKRLQPMLGALVEQCRADPIVRAAWLGGSLARDTADDWSDIDLHLLVGDADSFSAAASDWMHQITPTVLADPIPGVAGGFLFITPDWIHIDLIVHAVGDFTQSDLPARVLVDRSGLVHDVAATDSEMRGEAYLPIDQVNLFLYFMGVTVTVIKRGEWAACRQGAAMFRDTLLIPLMLAENGVTKTDGAKRLNRYISAEQIATLDEVSPASSSPQDLIAAHVAIAREYLTRGRRLARSVGVEWPDALEQASVGLWQRELGVSL